MCWLQPPPVAQQMWCLGLHLLGFIGIILTWTAVYYWLKGWVNEFHVPGSCKGLRVIFGVLWERGDPPSLHCNVLYSIQSITAPSSWLLHIFNSCFICFKDPGSTFYLAPEVVSFIWCAGAHFYTQSPESLLFVAQGKDCSVCDTLISLVVCQVMNPSSEHMARQRIPTLKSNNSHFNTKEKIMQQIPHRFSMKICFPILIWQNSFLFSFWQ